MPNLLINIPSFLYWIIGVILLVIVVIIIAIFVSKHLAEKRKRECFNLLCKICEEKINNDYKIEYSNSSAYDFFIETEEYKYLIKLVININNQEICVNNAIKWQLRNNAYEKQIRFVEGVEELMRMDFESNGKRVRKLFIIYPNARALLKVINECEMVFVHPETDIYGANIITYNELVENNELLKL